MSRASHKPKETKKPTAPESGHAHKSAERAAKKHKQQQDRDEPDEETFFSKSQIHDASDSDRDDDGNDSGSDDEPAEVREDRQALHEKLGLDRSGYERPPKWYEHPALDMSKYQFKKAAPKPERPVTIEELRAQGEATLAAMSKTDQKTRLLARADQKWIDELLQTGTLSDKISALTLQVRNHPLQCKTNLEHLLGFARKKGRRETLMSMEALQDLFLSELIPRNRKLKLFKNQLWVKGYVFHTEHPNDSRIPHTHQFAHRPPNELLALWVLEDTIKTSYHALLEVIETGLYDPVDYIKRKHLKAAFALLSELSEGEDVLLALIVNKMGDANRSIAGRAERMVKDLMAANPGMRVAIIQEVERLLFRPHVKERAQYHALCFLNQIVYRDGDWEFAQAMIRIYFALFRTLVVRTNRAREEAARIANLDDKTKKKLKKRRQVRQKRNPEKAQITKEIQALGITNKILSAILIGVNRSFPFALSDPTPESQAALQKVMDENTEMLFGVVSNQDNFMLSIQALMLLYQIMSMQDSFKGRYYMALYKMLISPMILTTSKQTLFLNLLFKSLKNDTETRRVLGFVKRMAQIAAVCTPNFGCALLFVISEVGKTHKAIFDFAADVDAQARELYKILQEKRRQLELENEQATEAELDAKVGEVYAKIAEETLTTLDPKKLYDGAEGDALYSHAENTAFWELLLLCAHYHPSLALFARTILNGEDIVYRGNPLIDYTQQAFFDRFTQRKPKPEEKLVKGTQNVHCPKFKLMSEASLRQLITLTSQADKVKETDVRPDDKFILKFFQNRSAIEEERKAVEMRKAVGKEYDLQDGEDLEAFADRLMNEEMTRLQRGEEPDDDIDDYDAFDEALRAEGIEYDGGDEDEDAFADSLDFGEEDAEAGVEEDEDGALEAEFDEDDAEVEAMAGRSPFDDDSDLEEDDDDDGEEDDAEAMIKAAKARVSTSRFVSADELQLGKLTKKHGGLQVDKPAKRKSPRQESIYEEEPEYDSFMDFAKQEDDADDDGLFEDDPLTSAARFGQMLEDTDHVEADLKQQEYYDALNTGRSLRRKAPPTKAKQSNTKRRK